MTERRYTTGELEARSEDSGLTIIGHASVWDTPYDLHGFTERVARGAFKKSLKEADVVALYNHDANVVLGRKHNGTLRLEEDDRGLRYEVALPNTQAANDLHTLITRGDIHQSSFSFEVVKDEWEERDDAQPLRTLKEVRLYDVSPVTFPASSSTDVDVARAVRSLREAMGIEGEADTVSDLMALRNTTPEPEPEPVEDHSESTQSEPVAFKPIQGV